MFNNTITSVNNNIDSNITSLDTKLSGAIDRNVSNVNASITDVNDSLNTRIDNSQAMFNNVKDELNTTLQYNVERLDSLADYKDGNSSITLSTYEANKSVFTSPDLTIQLTKAVDASNAKANEEALGTLKDNVDTLNEQEESGSLFVDFFKQLFSTNK
jgi:hypothetical protein